MHEDINYLVIDYQITRYCFINLQFWVCI